MTLSPPTEALHFRGKTLTPESPRPLHLPELANIPVLQNQMDPVFNDTSTYESHQDKPSDSALPGLGSAIRDYAGDSLQPSTYIQSNEGGRGDMSTVNGTGAAGTGSYSSLDVEQGSGNEGTSTAQNLLSSNNFTSDLPETSDQRSAAQGSSAPFQTDPNPLLDHSVDTSSENAPQYPQIQSASSEAAHPTFGLSDTQNTTIAALQDREYGDGSQARGEGVEAAETPNEGVNYQTLLDNLSPSAATAPYVSGITAATTTVPTDESNIPQTATERSLPTPAGLPPRPPPQEKPAIHPNYAATDSIRSFHNLHTQNSNVPTSYQSQTSNYWPQATLPPLIAAAGAPGTSSAPNGLLPPPLATFQQSQHPVLQQQSPSTPSYRQRDRLDSPATKGSASADGDDDTPWGPDVQRKYDEFLREERAYVTEGLWDRFPPGSRLFVGNLPTEKVTKRDLFHIFHKHGKLAQISIKQAYGFVQFLDASACYSALQLEQGGVVRGRKVHLEISKPQRNTRNAAQVENARTGARRRSRSPDRGLPLQSPRGGVPRVGGDRYDRSHIERLPFSDFRDEPSRKRDDYRPIRSPSPRGFRRTDEYRARDRSPERYDRRVRDRSRSPYARNARYRSPSPTARGYDEDADLPIPRRAPRDVPDVQIIILDEVDRNLVFHIEKTFQDRGIRSDVLMLSPRIMLQAVIRRQILEGVIAVVELSRASQYTGKIPLQIFDRSGGADNVRYNEYADLDLNIAADLTIHAKQTQQRTSQHSQPPLAQLPYGVPQPLYPQAPVHQPPPQQLPTGGPNVANLISNLDGPALQKLLGALQQPQGQGPPPQSAPQPPPHPQQQPPPPMTGANPADLASLLSSVVRQQNSQHHQSHQQTPQHFQGHSYAAPPPQVNPAFINNPAVAGLMGGAGNGQPSSQQQPAQHVQNIMEQLAQWRK